MDESAWCDRRLHDPPTPPPPFLACSMHGEKQHSTPSGRRLRAALAITRCGPGRSRNTASAAPSSSAGKPSASMLRCTTVTRAPRPCAANSLAACSARCWWNSKVCTWPAGPTARARECVREPEPVPDSSTTLPGRRSSMQHTSAMSATYRIWVLRE